MATEVVPKPMSTKTQPELFSASVSTMPARRSGVMSVSTVWTPAFSKLVRTQSQMLVEAATLRKRPSMWSV